MANVLIGLVVIMVFDDNIANKVSFCDWWLTSTTDCFCYAAIAVYEYIV